MREILFRGKAIYIEYPVKMINEQGITNIDIDFNTIGQYTGLTDCYISERRKLHGETT